MVKSRLCKQSFAGLLQELTVLKISFFVAIYNFVGKFLMNFISVKLITHHRGSHHEKVLASIRRNRWRSCP
jgi:hypothetical protein